MILKIDEINKRAIPYKEYFGVMNLTKKQIEDRIRFSERMEDELLTFYYLFSMMKDLSVSNDKILENQLRQVYLDVLVSVGVEPDDYLTERANTFAIEFVAVTREHIGDILLDKDLTPAQKWYLSADRLMFNAENEANTALNYVEYKDAVKRFKYKTWHTENDERVRPTHVPLEGQTIPITETFVVGETLMRFAKDVEYAADSPEEIVNCRCSTTYHN